MIKHSELVKQAVLDLDHGFVLDKEYLNKVHQRYKFHCRMRNVEPQDQIDTNYCLLLSATDSLDKRLAHYAKNGIDTTMTERERNAVIELLARLIG